LLPIRKNAFFLTVAVYVAVGYGKHFSPLDIIFRKNPVSGLNLGAEQQAGGDCHHRKPCSAFSI
jgi:hypothetical protein